MPSLANLLPILDSVAPLRFAESWDNVGLLVGDPRSSVERALVTVDLTPEVLEEARAQGAQLIVAYHPPLFAAVKRVPHDAVWAEAVRHGIALYSTHTALDVARGGTNDLLADLCGMHDVGRAPLRPWKGDDAGVKLVTFVPREHLARLSEALFEAGAGVIGHYTRCSFRSEGTGTFLGGEGTEPAVGSRGVFEEASEIRLETLVPRARVSDVVSALRDAHPYEEPAFDLVELGKVPSNLGLGRVGAIDPLERMDLVHKVKSALRLSHVLMAGPATGLVRRLAVAAGSGGELVVDALRARADVLVTGELRHHDALEAARRGLTVIAALHSNSERAAIRVMAARLAHLFEGVEVRMSAVDADPFTIV